LLALNHQNIRFTAQNIIWHDIREKNDYGYEFLAVPYAHAERFKLPVESKWDGIRECISFGPKAIVDGLRVNGLSLCENDN
jgi:hypothetical protein